MKPAWQLAALLAFSTLGIHPSESQEAMEPAAILKDLRENNLSAEEIRSIDSLSSVRVVSLADFSGPDLQALDETLRKTEDNFAEVRTAIVANEAVEAALNKQGVPLSRVIAMTRSETGGVTFFTGERSTRPARHVMKPQEAQARSLSR